MKINNLTINNSYFIRAGFMNLSIIIDAYGNEKINPTSSTEPHLIDNHLLGEYTVRLDDEYGNEFIQLLIISSITNAQMIEVKNHTTTHFFIELYNSFKWTDTDVSESSPSDSMYIREGGG